MHTYTIDWQPDSLTWAVDGTVLRTLNRNTTYNSTTGQYHYPQTPSKIELSLWPAGLASNGEGTIDWAGGLVNWESSAMSNGYYYAMVKEVVSDYLSISIFDLLLTIIHRLLNATTHLLATTTRVPRLTTMITPLEPTTLSSLVTTTPSSLHSMPPVTSQTPTPTRQYLASLLRQAAPPPPAQQMLRLFLVCPVAAPVVIPARPIRVPLALRQAAHLPPQADQAVAAAAAAALASRREPLTEPTMVPGWLQAAWLRSLLSLPQPCLSDLI